MMVNEHAFLQAILNEPEADAPRLVFADWLEEQGEGDRAEFIRIQCDMARRRSDDEHYSGLQASERRLLVANARRWCEDWYVGHRFRRGFLESIRCASPGHFLDNAERLFDAAPIREIWFDTQEDIWEPSETAALADSPYLARVRDLRLPPGRSFAVPTEALLTFTNSPHLTALQSLELGHGMCYSLLDDGLFAELIGAGGRPIPPCFHNLHHLGLNDARIGDASVAALVASPLGDTLTRLDLSDNSEISTTGVLKLVSSPLWERLTELDISNINPHPLGRGLLVEALGRSELRRVALRADPSVLGNASSWGPVEALRLHCHGLLRDDDLRTFLACPHLTALTRLDLPYGGLSAEGTSLLAFCSQLAGLTALSLEDNPLGDEGVQALAASPHLTRLAYLNLHGTGVTDAGLAALARMPLLSRLRLLDLSCTEVSDYGLLALADSPYLTRLTTLNLEGAEGTITDAGLLALADSPHLPCLTYLGLWDQQFPKNGWQTLVEPKQIAWPGLSWSTARSNAERQAYKDRFGWFEGRENLDWEQPFFT